MKKICIILLIFIYTVGMVACGKQNVSQDATSANENVERSNSQKEENDWSKQDITNMFYSMTNGEIGLAFRLMMVM